MKIKFFLFTWFTTAVILFALNGVFHGVLVANFFDENLSGLGHAAVKMKDFKPLPIVVLELALDFCLVVIITRLRDEPVKLNQALLTGGLFYFSTAISWNLANSATLAIWPVVVTLVDAAWHFVTGILAGYIIYKIFNLHFRQKRLASN